MISVIFLYSSGVGIKRKKNSGHGNTIILKKVAVLKIPFQNFVEPEPKRD